MPVIIGIDEAGCGPLAGPVVVAAVALPPKLKLAKLLKRGNDPLRLNRMGKKFWLKDSKKLTFHQRLVCFNHIKNHPRIKIAIVKISPQIIDEINILNAANLGVDKAWKKIIKQINPKSVTEVLLDGRLKLPSEIKHRTIIRGDQKHNAIKLASIVAKVSRDRHMNYLHRLYPQYGFNEHQGYGTKKHQAALHQHGPSPIHRKSFIKKFV